MLVPYHNQPPAVLAIRDVFWQPGFLIQYFCDIYHLPGRKVKSTDILGSQDHRCLKTPQMSTPHFWAILAARDLNV